MATEGKKIKKNEKEEEAPLRLRVKICAYDHRIIDQAVQTIMETGRRNNAVLIGPVPLPTEKKVYTVNRSTFVHKDAREQYEMRLHKRLIDILDPNPKLIDALQHLNLPAGVEVEIKM
jgi:small subunit ribosomal protein S10